MVCRFRSAGEGAEREGERTDKMVQVRLRGAERLVGADSPPAHAGCGNWRIKRPNLLQKIWHRSVRYIHILEHNLISYR